LKRRRVKRRVWLAVGALLLLLVITGCRTVSYYAQAVRGQYQIVRRARPIGEVLASSVTTPGLSNQLSLVLKLRAFAEQDLKLKANGHYLNYADLGRRYVVWNVYAAPEFSMESRTWWYPIVGSLKYRGYFDELEARRLGTNLAERGFDVYVGGVEAYSTLGWFRDPVLNTFVFDAETELAETLFHELAHQRVFISGDTDFNEAFATAVGEEGVRRWLLAKSDAAACSHYAAETARKREFIALLATTHARLAEIYGEAANNGSYETSSEKPNAIFPEEKRRLKAQSFEQLRRDYERLKARWGGSTEWDAWFHKPLNNARLNTVDTYYKWVPAFHELLRANGGNLEKFYEEVKRLGKRNVSERQRLLRAHLPAATE
jgi:predicted aminopeptidase